MQQPRALGVIPVRLESRRLPRKPLHELGGRPLIEWVWRAASRLDSVDQVVVATDSEEIARVCHALGAPVVPTLPGHESGTDRVAEVAAAQDPDEYDVIVNIQGDEPFITEAQVGPAVDLVRAGWAVGTAAARIEDPGALADPAVVKVVRGDDGRALYFSRAPIPFDREAGGAPRDLASGCFLRHIGVYAYAPAALAEWVELPVHDLERTERLEQLRPLAAGMKLGVAIVSAVEGGVDTPADVARAEARLAGRG